MKNILFIINPHSGMKLIKNVDNKIVNSLVNTNINPIIIKTEYGGHATKIAQEAVNQPNPPDAIIAVGGDGTINEVITGIGQTGIPMGIIPKGSGNGFARHLGISLFPFWAIKTIIDFHIQPIDIMKIGKNKFGTNVVGVGFDAVISQRFKDSKLRGPISYVKIILEEFLKHQPANYKIELDGKEIDVFSPMVTVANSTQFGNNALIAPKASITDGLLDLCVIKPFPKAMALDIAGKIMIGTIENSKYYERYTAKKIIIQQEKAFYQIDGDSIKKKKKIKVEVIPSGLNMIIPKKSINKI